MLSAGAQGQYQLPLDVCRSEGTVAGSHTVSQSLHPSSTALATKGADMLFLQSAERLQGVPDLKPMLHSC